MDWNTYYHYPVAYKKWLIERLGKELDRGKNQDLLSAPQNNSQTMNNRFKKFTT